MVYAEVAAFPSLREAFQDESCRVNVTSMFVDIVNSTQLQANEPEGSWIPQTGWFYDLVDDLVRGAAAPLCCKFLGDGIMITTDAAYATEVVNLAIQIQEGIRRNGPRPDGTAGRIAFNVSIGIVTGAAIRFQSPDGLVDFTSKAISSARRLCDAATARAIFMDLNTEICVNGILLSSEIGRAQRRTAPEYRGEPSSIMVKGLANPLQYYEVWWEVDRFGLKNETVASDRPTGGGATRAQSSVSSGQRVSVGGTHHERLAGRVKCWGVDKGFGFITAESGEEFYFNKALLAYDDDAKELQEGLRVAFTSAPAADGKCRRATLVLLDGEEATARVHVAPSVDRPHGWLAIDGERGAIHMVYVRGDALPTGARKGTEVNFRVAVGTRGASAVDLELVGGEGVAA